MIVIAFGGAFVNFWLIQRPMSAMGIFLLETLRITHLFPGISAMSDKMRRGLMWVSLTILIILAGVEVGLAVMRDQIILADMAFKQDLVSGGKSAAKVAADLGWVHKVPVAGQMILGFILPFALAFVGIPLEYFIQSARTVFGSAVVLVLRGFGVLLKLTAAIARHLGTAITMLFDMFIFIPVLIERFVRAKGVAATGKGSHAS